MVSTMGGTWRRRGQILGSLRASCLVRWEVFCDDVFLLPFWDPTLTSATYFCCLRAMQMSFQLYSGGVLTAACGTNLDHGVLLVGYGVSEDGIKYWKVKIIRVSREGAGTVWW